MHIDEKPSYKMRQLWDVLSELTYSEMRTAAELVSEAAGDLVGYDTKVEKIQPADWMEVLDTASLRWKEALAAFEETQVKPAVKSTGDAA